MKILPLGAFSSKVQAAFLGDLIMEAPASQPQADELLGLLGKFTYEQQMVFLAIMQVSRAIAELSQNDRAELFEALLKQNEADLDIGTTARILTDKLF
jgi:hypothetical protein